MVFTQDEQIIIAIVVVLVFFILRSKRSDSESSSAEKKSPYMKASISNVEDVIVKNFQLKMQPKLKDGYTEKSIEMQLEKLFQEKFKYVVTQYGLEGIQGQKIDFDIGEGKVGVEIKTAKSVFKASAQDRMMGQIQAYIKSRYNDDNLLLVIFCEAEHMKERAVIDSIKKRVEDMQVTPLFVEINAQATVK